MMIYIWIWFICTIRLELERQLPSHWRCSVVWIPARTAFRSVFTSFWLTCSIMLGELTGWIFLFRYSLQFCVLSLPNHHLLLLLQAIVMTPTFDLCVQTWHVISTMAKVKPFILFFVQESMTSCPFRDPESRFRSFTEEERRTSRNSVCAALYLLFFHSFLPIPQSQRETFGCLPTSLSEHTVGFY